MIDLFKVFMAPDVLEHLAPILACGYVGEGLVSQNFEKKIGEFIKNPNVAVVNSGTSAITLALRLAGVGPGTSVVTTPMTCLWGRSRVMLPNGESKEIRDLVRTKYTGDVLSIDSEGRIVPKRVIGWYESKRKGRGWKHISCHTYPKQPGPYTTKSGVWVTEEHQILTPDGYVKAQDLAEMDVVTAYKGLTRAHEQFLIGSLLGDGSLGQSTRGMARLTICQSVSQREWFEIKSRFVAGLGGHPREYPARIGHQAYLFHQTGNHPALTQVRNRFYPGGEKRLPLDFSTRDVTPMALATWYMDDGSKTSHHAGCLCTEGFSEPDVERLASVLRAMGYTATVHAVKKGNGHRILIRAKRIGSDGRRPLYQSDKFFADIAPFVPASLRYKLPEDVQEILFDPSRWAPIEFPRYIDRAEIMEGEPRYDAKRTVYCLDVEDTHNFIVNGIVVHNCLATNMPILSLGADPIWADILPDGTLNSEDAYRKIRNDTRAILCVDWGGMPCHLASLRVVADYKSIPLIEDACQSLGGTYRGTPIGNHADAVCFSFQAIKYLTTVDGGALVCNWNHGNLKRAKLLRWFGLDRTQSSMLRCGQDPPDWGYKFQTNDVLASIGLANLASLAERLEIVRGNALQYQEAFKDLQCVKTIPEGEDRQSAFWAYTLLVEDVDSFVRFLRTKGVVASKIHDRNDTKTIFAPYRQEALPGVDYFDRHHVCIPVGWWVGAPERHTIITAVKEWDTCEAGA